MASRHLSLMSSVAALSALALMLLAGGCAPTDVAGAAHTPASPCEASGSSASVVQATGPTSINVLTIKVTGPPGASCSVRGYPKVEEQQRGRWDPVPLAGSSLPDGATHRLPMRTVALRHHRAGYLLMSFGVPTCSGRGDAARLQLPGLLGWMPLRGWDRSSCAVAGGETSPVQPDVPLPPAP